MPNFNFSTVRKGKHYQTLPSSIVRLSSRTITVSSDVVNRLFVASRFTHPEQNWMTVKMAIDIDTENKALRIRESTDGFSAKVAPGIGTLYMPLPVWLRRAGLPIGDYILVDGETSTFKLAE